VRSELQKHLLPKKACYLERWQWLGLNITFLRFNVRFDSFIINFHWIFIYLNDFFLLKNACIQNVSFLNFLNKHVRWLPYLAASFACGRGGWGNLEGGGLKK
jgi:hypothetical protein